jgi:GNAT superfamily N-acetyltransferase
MHPLSCLVCIAVRIAFQTAPKLFSLEAGSAADDAAVHTGSKESSQPMPEMVGFARLISDSARFAFLADLYIHPPYRRLGLGKALLSCVNDHPANRVYLQMTRLPSCDSENKSRHAVGSLLERSGYTVATQMDSGGIYAMHTVRSVSVAVNEENIGPREWRSDKCTSVTHARCLIDGVIC